jgi:GNAT superfamily N-acetyltransferase
MHGQRSYALAENVIVDRAEQGKGRGRALFRFIDQFCFERDCSKIMLLSNIRRSDAHRFFERCGYSSEAKLGFLKYRRQISPNG